MNIRVFFATWQRGQFGEHNWPPLPQTSALEIMQCLIHTGGLLASSSDWHIYFSYHSIVNIFNKLPTLKKNVQLKKEINSWVSLKKNKKKELVKNFSKEDIWMANTWRNAQHCSLLEKCKYKLQWGITSYWSEWPSSKIYKQ